MNIIDSRNLITLAEELESDIENISDEELNQLKEIKLLREDIAGFDDGIALIDVDDFEEYAESIGTDQFYYESVWPFTYINWEKAAQALLEGYREITYDGMNYYVEVR